MLVVSVRDLHGKRKQVLSLLLLFFSLVLAVAFHLKTEKIVDPGSDDGYHPVPVVEMKTFETDSGLVLFVPKSGDQAWDAELPNTPYPYAGLELRQSNDLSSGFWVPSGGEGWKMADGCQMIEVGDQKPEGRR